MTFIWSLENIDFQKIIDQIMTFIDQSINIDQVASLGPIVIRFLKVGSIAAKWMTSPSPTVGPALSRPGANKKSKPTVNFKTPVGALTNGFKLGFLRPFFEAT